MLNRFHQRLIEWNVFKSDDDGEQSTANPDPRLLKEQRIATRVYLIFLLASLLILMICTLLRWQTKVVVIYNPSLKIYQELQKTYPTTLSCPCTIVTMPYKNFLITEVVMHQICSSDFVSQKWIDALYISDASRYGAIDFRTTANSQFELLKTLCTFAHDNIFDALFNLNNTQLLTTSVLPVNTIFIRTKISSERIRIDTLVHLNNALKLIQLSTHSNRISSALNTNCVLGVLLSSRYSMYRWSIGYTLWYWTDNNKTTICHCDQSACSFPVGFYSFANIGNFSSYVDIEPQKYNASDFVPGFVGSCIPLDAILEATFVCLYDMECIMKLVPYFPQLAQLIPSINTLNHSISSKYPIDVNVSHLVEELFLEQWNISIDYNRYYTQCAPKLCTYSYKKQANFVYMITLLISLYGGLETILRFLIPLIVKYLMKKRSNTIDNNTEITTNQINIQKKLTERIIVFIGSIKRFLINLNLFQSVDRSPEAIHHQRLSTKCYLCLVIGSLFVLLLFTTISEQTTSIIYQRPLYLTYQQLYIKHSDKLICPCTEITATYSSFINITPIYHPVCSSAFVEKIWFDQLQLTKPTLTGINMLDWRLSSNGYFRALAALCKLADDTVKNGLQKFGTRTIVTTQVLNEVALRNEINDTIEELIQSMQTEFERVNNILRLLYQVNQYFTGSSHNGHLRVSNQSKDERIVAQFLFDGPSYSDDEPTCLCAFHPDCEEPMIIGYNRTHIYVPGFVMRCSAMDSILHSTLECLYSNTNCLTDVLLHYINYTSTAVPVPPLDVSQLIRTSTNSKVATLADNLFIEEWNSIISYENYFRICAPNTCQYTYAQRANYLYIVTVFLAVYGGLTFALRLLIPLVVKFILLQCRRPPVLTDNQTILERTSKSARLRAAYHYLRRIIRAKTTDLNLFQTYSFDKDLDQVTRNRLGRLTTRLYIVLYAIGLIILALYTSIEQRTLTTNIDNPSLLVAKQLQAKYIDTTECPCTKASIPIDEFVRIQPQFHQICTSVFVTNEWRETLTTDLNNMSYFMHIGDYRPYFLAHLQLLSGLCQHAIKHVNDTIRSFISTSFVTSRLLSQSSFEAQLSNLLNQTEIKVITTFNRSLELAQVINHDNKLLSIYGSNYELDIHQNRTSHITVVYTKPMTYYKSTNCSCGLQSNCVAQAAFTWPHYVAVKGFLIGCLPSQSLLASTLECFFDVDCINLIRNHMPVVRTHAHPLNDTFHSRYKINTTVNELVSKLFIEEWLTNISYEHYFLQCAPNICSYSYIDNANPLYVATTLLGLYGGLTVILSWWSPQFVKLIRRIQTHYKRKRQVSASTP